MKLNKRVAAGALALALVTPVVANAANETVYLPSEVKADMPEKANWKGTTYNKAEFEKQLEKFNKAYNEYLVKEAEYNKYDEAYKAAVKRYEDAYAAYQAELDKDPAKKVTSKYELAKVNLQALTKATFSDANDWEVKKDADGKVIEAKLSDAAYKNLTDNIDKTKTTTEEFEAKYETLVNEYIAKVNAPVVHKTTLAELYREYQTSAFERDRIKGLRDSAKDEEKKKLKLIMKKNTTN